MTLKNRQGDEVKSQSDAGIRQGGMGDFVRARGGGKRRQIDSGRDAG